MMNKEINNEEKCMYAKVTTCFKNDLIKESLKLQYTNSKIKINDEALELMKEIAKALSIETAVRAAKQAKFENKTTVSLDNVEAILPQMMLDFP